MTNPTDFYAKGALRPTPTDVQVFITGRPGAGKTLVAGALKAALEGLPSTTVCLDQRLREIEQSMAPDYLGHERARLKEHPLFVGLAEVAAAVPPPEGPKPRLDFCNTAAPQPSVAETELRFIDSILARRPALADCANRAVAIEKAIATAGLYDLAQKKLDEVAAEAQKLKLDLQNACAVRDEQTRKLADAEKKLDATLSSLAMLEGRMSQSTMTVDMRQGAQPLPEPYAAVAGDPKPPTVTIDVYIDDGRVFYYDVAGVGKAREHADAIIKTGYRHVAAGDLTTLECFPPHRISKVKVKAAAGVATDYTDRERGT